MHLSFTMCFIGVRWRCYRSLREKWGAVTEFRNGPNLIYFNDEGGVRRTHSLDTLHVPSEVALGSFFCLHVE